MQALGPSLPGEPLDDRRKRCRRRSAGSTGVRSQLLRSWCSHDPTRVADHLLPGGTIAINGGDPTEVTEVARSFIDAVPDIRVFVDEVVFNDKMVEYHWTFTGTNTGPGGAGKAVRITGLEEWTIGDDGLVVESRGTYDQDEYDRQLQHGG